MKKVVIATNNRNKIKEISAILRLDDVEFLSLDDLNIDFDVEETGLTVNPPHPNLASPKLGWGFFLFNRKTSLLLNNYS